MRAYEQALEVQPGNAGALEALAHLRELTGDSHAALTAIEALASKAKTPEAQAEQWLRAGRLLEGRGDMDGAIERYKAAIEANPKDAGASSALRKAYAQRGDAASVVAQIEKELEFAEGKLAKARLYAEPGRIYRDKLKDDDKAGDVARRRPTSTPRTPRPSSSSATSPSRGRGTSRRRSTTSRSSPARRCSAKEDAVRVLTRYVEAFSKAFGDAAPPRRAMPRPRAPPRRTRR